jgi:dihydroneopterin aldolase
VIESRIFVSGIRATGRHGATPGEKDVPQEFVVDLDVTVRTGADTVTETADYREITRVARRVVEEGSFDLVEHLADAVARAVQATDRVVRVTAVVHKPAAARSVGVDGIAVAVTAEG